MDRPPWQAWLTEDLYRELFRGGQADLDAFYDQVEDEERRYGIRAKCRDAEVYAVVARSRRATPMILRAVEQVHQRAARVSRAR